MSTNVAMSRTVQPSLVSKLSDSEFVSLVERYQSVRRFTEQLCEPLTTEDYIIQSMPDVSPTKWHIAHTSWFFETFILSEAYPEYRSPNPQYGYLFNSYYVAAGQRHCRPKRGLLSRPTVQDVYDYRAHVDQHMLALLDVLDGAALQRWAPIVEIGLHHEQQHQELMLTDLKHNLSINPLRPAYRDLEDDTFHINAPALRWIRFPEGVHSIGYDGNGFSYDNESPRHRVFVEPFELASRLITNGEYLNFIADGGYQRPELWLLMGWNMVQQEGWDSPLYWERYDDGWWMMTLAGMQPINEAAPVCHINYYEADAFARWSGARLPTEAEWEIAADQVSIQGNFVETSQLHPVPLVDEEINNAPSQMFGDVWEWTQSHYSPYPGYQPAPGAIGEYNGKFMANQFVLRGGSCVTSVEHIRPTYRNFLHADASWQFSGIRLAKTVKA